MNIEDTALMIIPIFALSAPVGYKLVKHKDQTPEEQPAVELIVEARPEDIHGGIEKLQKEALRECLKWYKLEECLRVFGSEVPK